MLFLKRKPGESLVIETPNGPIVIQLLNGEEIGIEAPPGVEVSQAAEANRSASWLPARPDRTPRALA